MPTRYPVLIFDFGNVVAYFDYGRACAVLGRPAGLSGEELLTRLRDLGFSELVHQYEAGAMTAESFSTAVGELMDVGVGFTHDEFAAAWADIFTLNEPVARLVASLKAKGYTLVLGSNTNDLHAAHFRRQFAETMACFDHLVLSYEVRAIKPSPAFYIACAEAVGVAPAECLFIDDMPENVEGARAAGLAGLVFRDLPTLCIQLRESGVEVGEG